MNPRSKIGGFGLIVRVCGNLASSASTQNIVLLCLVLNAQFGFSMSLDAPRVPPEAGRILWGKSFNQENSGNEVYYAASSL